MRLIKALLAAAFLFVAGPALAQSGCGGQFGAGQFCGNPGPGTGLPRPVLITPSVFQPIPGGTVIGNPTGASAIPIATTAPVLGIPGTSTGQVGLAGSASGTAILRAQTTAGSAVSLLPTAAGTLVGTSAAPLAIDAATGEISITGLSGAVLAGPGPTFQRTPVLGVPGSAIGTLGFAGNTSGTATIIPQAAAGSPTLTLPNTSGTFAVGASSPLVLNATTGALTCPTCATTSGGGSLSATTPLTLTGNVLSLDTNGVTYSFFQQVAASSLVGNPTGALASAQGITLGSTLTFSGSALQTAAISGDVTSSANSFATTLATVNSNVGTFGSATQVGVFTVNGKGLVTAASNSTIALNASQATGALDTMCGGSPSQGSLIYRNATVWTCLPASATSGQVLTNNGTGTNPSWTSVGGTGTVTSVSAGTGLTASPNPIVGSGTISLASIAADNLLANSTGSSAAPIATPIGSCSAATSALTYNTTTHAFGCNTIAGGVTSIAGNTGAFTLTQPITNATNAIVLNATIFPQGRVTLATATPVMSTTVSGATTVYYTPYLGNLVPIYNGTNVIPTAFAEVSQATTDTTKSPAAVTTNSNYDVFCWVDSGTNRCTRGPAWSSSTTRGTGAGTTELVRVNGIYLNANAITNGPAAQRGTYVGTIRSNGSSAIDYIFGGAAAGGTAGSFGVFNAYNRVFVATSVTDTTSSWTMSSATPTAMNPGGTGSGLNNRVSFVSGLPEESVGAAIFGVLSTAASASSFGRVGVVIDATNSFDCWASAVAVGSVSNAAPLSCQHNYAPQLGFHFVQAVQVGDGTSTVTVNGGTQLNGLSVQLRM